MNRTAVRLALLWAIVAAPLSAQSGFLIDDVLILDGTGAPAVHGAVRVEGGRIAALGALTPLPGERVVAGHGFALAPGFIDTHSHADGDLEELPDALGAVSQGITTVIVGQDGSSPYPLADFYRRLEQQPVALNVAAYAGHNTIREFVLLNDWRRVATAEEIGRMKVLLRQELAAGALGLSTGLEYDPGIYSAPGEILALAHTTADAGGRYISHVRSEDRHFWAAIEELLTIGRAARLPVQISHVKLAMRSLWGQADSLIRRLNQARAEGIDVTADIYPYPYWHSTLTVLFPERDYSDRREAEFAVTQVSTPAGLKLGVYQPNPEFTGRTVADVAQALGVDSVTALIELIARAERMRAEGGSDVESVIGTSMIEPDIEALIRWPFTNFCTDGSLAGRHPRGFGTYPRFLGRYVRERSVLGLAEAVHRGTALAAEHVGITDRGRIAPGFAADLVLFDPATVLDRATPDEPHALSEGIMMTWVNGDLVYQQGQTTGRRPGQVLRRVAHR